MKADDPLMGIEVYMYRVSYPIANLSWGDFDLDLSPSCPIPISQGKNQIRKTANPAFNPMGNPVANTFLIM